MFKTNFSEHNKIRRAKKLVGLATEFSPWLRPRQQDSSGQSFLGHFGRVAEASWLGSLYSAVRSVSTFRTLRISQLRHFVFLHCSWSLSQFVWKSFLMACFFVGLSPPFGVCWHHTYVSLFLFFLFKQNKKQRQS